MRQFLVIFLILSISGCGGIATRYRIIDTAGNVEIKAPQKELKVGEKFTYKAEWLGMDVAVVTLCIEDIVDFNGRPAYRIVATVNSTPVISKVYKIEDTVCSYMDVEKLIPMRFEKKQIEGKYRSDEYTDFDHKEGKASYTSRLNNSKKEYVITKAVQDLLSCIYYFRLQDEVEVGKSLFADVNADEKTYLLEAKICKKGSLRISGFGEWNAFLVEPLPWFQGRIERKAKADIWFSSDEQRIPLLVTTKGIPFVGIITITLQKIEYLESRDEGPFAPISESVSTEQLPAQDENAGEDLTGDND